MSRTIGERVAVAAAAAIAAAGCTIGPTNVDSAELTDRLADDHGIDSSFVSTRVDGKNDQLVARISLREVGCWIEIIDKDGTLTIISVNGKSVEAVNLAEDGPAQLMELCSESPYGVINHQY